LGVSSDDQVICLEKKDKKNNNKRENYAFENKNSYTKSQATYNQNAKP